jgi:putative Mg2+ transporter-C (MgtC) family protein
MKNWESELEVLGQCVLAIVLGGVLGWEREKAGKWAGFRTHMLVCLAALLYVRVGQFLVRDAEQSAVYTGILQTDPSRLIEAIVTGIAFIGAGTVFRGGQSKPHGLTTAATLLTVGPIGIAVAIERYILAVGITVLAYLILRVIGLFEFKHLRGIVEPKDSKPHSES